MKKCIAVISIIILSAVILNHFFQPEAQRFSRILDRGTYVSPNGEYELVMQLCVSDSDKSLGWFRGTLFKNKSESTDIYWDKVEGDAFYREIDVEWANMDIVKIGDMEFNVSDFPEVGFYDYNIV